MTDADRRVLQAYLDRPLDDLMDELSLYDPTARGAADVWQKLAGPLHQRLCVDGTIVRFARPPDLKAIKSWRWPCSGP